jgi:hypothetical protein
VSSRPDFMHQQVGRGNHAAALRLTTDCRRGALRAPCPLGHAAIAAGEAQKGVKDHCAELRLACAVRRHVGSPGTLSMPTADRTCALTTRARQYGPRRQQRMRQIRNGRLHLSRKFGLLYPAPS